MLKGISSEAQAKSEEFLKIAEDFKLGTLLTEQPAPETEGLSENSKQNLPKAVQQIQSLDVKTLKIIKSKIPELRQLYDDVRDTLESGNRIYLSGCGATGRLSLALESLWRQEVRDKFQNSAPETYDFLIDKVVSLMAGGDIALIKSVEDFEDHPEFGETQMKELGFGENDLLIASTEGGETPWVIGTVEYAAKTSKRSPYFTYCNPDEILIDLVERSRRVLKNDKIKKINLTVGNMGITGSTRMQATTIQMYAAGLALFGQYKLKGVSRKDADAEFESQSTQILENFIDYYTNLKLDQFLPRIIEKEHELYQKKNHLFYTTDYYFSLTILTDTTERSPTFSLFPFENQLDQDKEPSLVHLVMKRSQDNTTSIQKAWQDLLGFRNPRFLDSDYWKAYKNKVSTERAEGHDFSENLFQLRKSYCGNTQHFCFDIKLEGENLKFKIDEFANPANVQLEAELDIKQINFTRLEHNILLKMILNTHSTLIMARMGKLLSNIMTWVRPSNNKLIDRSIRYIIYLYKHLSNKLKIENPIELDYPTCCLALHQEAIDLVYGQAIVIKTVKKIFQDFHNIKITEDHMI